MLYGSFDSGTEKGTHRPKHQENGKDNSPSLALAAKLMTYVDACLPYTLKVCGCFEGDCLEDITSARPRVLKGLTITQGKRGLRRYPEQSFFLFSFCFCFFIFEMSK